MRHISGNSCLTLSIHIWVSTFFTGRTQKRGERWWEIGPNQTIALRLPCETWERDEHPAASCKADGFPQFQLSWWKNGPFLELFDIEKLPFDHDLAMHLAYLSSWSKYTSSQVFYHLPHGFYLCFTPLRHALNRVHQHILLKYHPAPPKHLDTTSGNNGPQSELPSTGLTTVICSCFL